MHWDHESFGAWEVAEYPSPPPSHWTEIQGEPLAKRICHQIGLLQQQFLGWVASLRMPPHLLAIGCRLHTSSLIPHCCRLLPLALWQSSPALLSCCDHFLTARHYWVPPCFPCSHDVDQNVTPGPELQWNSFGWLEHPCWWLPVHSKSNLHIQ